MEEAKFKKFFDQIDLKGDARLEAIKAIIKAAETQEECMQVDGCIPKAIAEGSNKICFTEVDRDVKYIHDLCT